MSNQFTYKPLEKERLIEVYINSNRSMKESAVVLSCSVKKIWKSLDYWGIKAKSKGGPGKTKKNVYSPDRIRHLEWKKSQNLLKEKYGFIPRFTEEQVKDVFNKFNPSTRRMGKELGCSYKYIEKLLMTYGLGIPIKKKVWKNYFYPILRDKEWLLKQVKEKSLREIAKEVGCSYSAVMWSVNRFGIRSLVKYTRPGPRNGNLPNTWKDGRKFAGDYVSIYSPEHVNTTKSGYVMEHRLVAEKKIGRLLEDYEDVHHINGDKRDNRPENLEVVTRKEHSKLHFDAVKEVVRLKKILEDHNISY